MQTPVSASTSKDISLGGWLKAAVMSAKIYPSDSPMVSRTIPSILQAAQSMLKTRERFTLTCRQSRIFAEGREDVEAAALAAVYIEQGIQSLTFLPGVSAEEISALVALFSRKSRDGKKFSDLMQQSGVTHILADRITVVEIEDGEVVTKKMDLLFSQVQDFPGLVGSLREAYDMIDRVPTVQERDKLQNQMAGRLAEMPSHLLKDLFENPLPSRVEESGLRDSVVQKMTSEKVHDILNEIGQWYENVRRSAASDVEAVEHLGKLKGFLGKILSSPASRNVPFSVYEELLQNGLIQSVPDGIRKEAGEESVPAQVDRLLAAPNSALLEAPTRDRLPALIEKLCGLGLYEMAHKLVLKLADNFYQESAILRQLAVRASRPLLTILWRTSHLTEGNHLLKAMMRLVDGERNAEVYKEVAETLAEAAGNLLIRDRMPEAVEVFLQLRKHAVESTVRLPRRQEIAVAVLEKEAREQMEVIQEGLQDADKNRCSSFQDVVNALGDFAAPIFIETVKRGKDQGLRRVAAQTLESMGENARRRFSEEFVISAPTPVLLNLLSVAGSSMAPFLLPSLKAFLRYPDPFVRGRVLQIVVKAGSEEAAALLERFLEDPDENVLMEAVRSAGEMRARSLVPSLGRLLETGAPLLQEEVCLAFGRIGDESAVSFLSRAVEARGGFLGRRSALEETVRVRAAWALSQILSPAAKEALRRIAATDPSLQIRLIAQESLQS